MTAVGAEAVQVETVALWGEASSVCCGCEIAVDQAFEFVVEVDVGDRAAPVADQVVVVFEEWLSELEVGVITADGDPLDHAALLEDVEVAVRGALRQIGFVFEDLGQGHGSAGAYDGIHESSAAVGVAMVVAREAVSDLGVDVPTRRLCAHVGSRCGIDVTLMGVSGRGAPSSRDIANRTHSHYREAVPASPRLLAVVTAVALAGVACGAGDSDEGGGDGPAVVATTGIWADVVANVACGGLVEVVTIVPAGGDPHAFEPSLADRGAMDDAELVVANGLGLEEGLEDTIDASEKSGTPVFRVADHLEALDDDPHIWFDPARVAGALDDLGAALVASAGIDADSVAACVADYRAELDAVDAEIVTLVADLPESRRKLVTSHDSMGYFANRYGFSVVGTVIPVPSTLAQASPAQLEDLAETIESAAVPAIFAEVQHSTADVEALANRVGDVAVVTLDTGSLGVPGGGADTYIGFLRTNAAAIVTALS